MVLGRLAGCGKGELTGFPMPRLTEILKKMSIKHIYLLGDRHYVNKVKFLLV